MNSRDENSRDFSRLHHFGRRNRHARERTVFVTRNHLHPEGHVLDMRFDGRVRRMFTRTVTETRRIVSALLLLEPHLHFRRPHPVLARGEVYA